MPKFRTSRNLTTAKHAHFFLTGPKKRNLKHHSKKTRAPHFQQRDCSMGGGSPRRMQSPRPLQGLFLCSPNFGNAPLPAPTQEFRKAALRLHSATWLLPLCRCPHVEVPDFLLHGGLLRVQHHPPESRSHRGGNPRVLRGLVGGRGGGHTHSASRPAQASENFRNCKRGHELEALELPRRRKRVLLRAPTFSKLSLREVFGRRRGATGSEDLWLPLGCCTPSGLR